MSRLSPLFVPRAAARRARRERSCTRTIMGDRDGRECGVHPAKFGRDVPYECRFRKFAAVIFILIFVLILVHPREVLLEPVAGEAGDFFQGARLLE